MRDLVSSFMSFCLANSLYAVQQTAKMLGVSPSLVNAKNPPGPGPDAKTPPTMTGQLYYKTKRTAEKFGDPAAVAFIAMDEYLSKAVDSVANVISSPRGFRPYWLDLPGQVVNQATLAAAAVGPETLSDR